MRAPAGSATTSPDVAVDEVPSSTARSYAALFAIPSIKRIVIGMTIARLAGSMVSVAVILFSLSLYNSPVLTGLVTFASIFPATVASPLAGALLDRHGRTRMVILDYVIGAASLILIAVLALLNALPPWLLVAIVAVASVTHPLSNTGLRTLFPLLVPRQLWNRVNAVDSNSFVVAQLIGPPLAGVAVQVLGPVVGLVTVGSLYAVAAVATLGIPEPVTADDTTGRLMTDARAGVAYVWHNRTLRGLAISMSTLNIGNGVQAIVLPVIVLQGLGGGPAMVGLAWGLSAVGGFVGALVFGRVETVGRERVILATCWAGTALGLALLLPAPSFALVFLAMLVTGALSGPANVTMFSLRQRRTDMAWLGRAFAVSSAFNFSGYPVGSAIAGALVERALQPAILFGVGMCVLAGVLGWLLIPQHDEVRTRR